MSSGNTKVVTLDKPQESNDAEGESTRPPTTLEQLAELERAGDLDGYVVVGLSGGQLVKDLEAESLYDLYLLAGLLEQQKQVVTSMIARSESGQS